MMTYLILLLLALCWFLASRKKNRVPLPPSPPADPLLGHLRYISPENQELQFAEWAKTYGDVMYLKVLNRRIVILSSAEAVLDLLERRSANYSDRPNFPVFDLMGWGDGVVFVPSGKKFQQHRRLLQGYFNRRKIPNYADMQIAQARHLALSFFRGKEDREHILQKFGTAVVVRIAFGHDMFSERDPVYDDMMRVHKLSMTSCGPPGNTMVDFFPILKHFPSWFPGTFYANRAREFYETVQRMHDYPIEKVQQGMIEGSVKPSFLSHHLGRLQQRGKIESSEDFRNVRGAAGLIFAAGSETMWSTLSAFLLAMVLHPDCQAKAQEELDRVLSSSRLPTFADRESLPYIHCIVQETFRWLAVTPLGMPHRAMEDDVYKGMFIPKGTVMFANVWAISRDERVYRDASHFNPSRYQSKSEGGNEEPLPTTPFGFGRRICPGRHLAETNVWIAIATLLTLFKIEKVKDENGNDIIPEVHLVTGLTSHPKPYECSIQVRNNAARVLLAEIEDELAVMT